MSYENSVFINSPFDDDFEPILQAIVFTVICLGFTPRLALEDADNSRLRLEKICELVSASKFGIHDISLCKTKIENYPRTHTDYWRLNMSFELGMDFGAKQFGQKSDKRILVLEEENYESKRTLSDISGWDIEAHQLDYSRAIKVVSKWLAKVSNCDEIPPSKLIGMYTGFQEWRYEKMLDEEFSEEDIQEYSTSQTITQMGLWNNIGRPFSYS